MAKSQAPTLSVVVPLFNEGGGLAEFHKSLLPAIKKAVNNSYEVIYCDDGSNDNTSLLVRQWRKENSRIKLLKLSRNFGKENTLSAGIAAAKGQAVLSLDGDGQHPVELIPKFVEAWEAGAPVVIGVRTNIGNFGSRLFYAVFNKVTDQELLPGSTDFRLIDRSVQQAFLGLRESDRITRGLIDWLGFEREYIKFEAAPRSQGAPNYSRRKLLGLAADSFVSLTPKPLYLFGYLGVFITISAFILGVAVIIEQLILGDPWNWDFTGTAMLGILILFLVGTVLLSQGILSMYISHIHSQTKRRPLYVIDRAGSAGIGTDEVGR